MNNFFNIKASLSKIESNVGTFTDDYYQPYLAQAKEQPAECLSKIKQQINELQKSLDEYYSSF